MFFQKLFCHPAFPSGLHFYDDLCGPSIRPPGVCVIWIKFPHSIFGVQCVCGQEHLSPFRFRPPKFNLDYCCCPETFSPSALLTIKLAQSTCKGLEVKLLFVTASLFSLLTCCLTFGCFSEVELFLAFFRLCSYNCHHHLLRMQPRWPACRQPRWQSTAVMLAMHTHTQPGRVERALIECALKCFTLPSSVFLLFAFSFCLSFFPHFPVIFVDKLNQVLPPGFRFVLVRYPSVVVSFSECKKSLIINPWLGWFKSKCLLWAWKRKGLKTIRSKPPNRRVIKDCFRFFVAYHCRLMCICGFGSFRCHRTFDGQSTQVGMMM